MFTGIVQALGRVRSTAAMPFGRRLVVEAEDLRSHAGSRGIQPGDSVCNSGVCLTAVEAQAGDGALAFDVVFETLQKTTLGAWKPGDAVNLELAVTPHQPLGGHFTQGHVDGVGEVRGIATDGGVYRIEVAPGREAMLHMVPCGSVALEGVSLTLARVSDDAFEVALIPETLAHTTLGALKAGDRVNLECDVLSKTLAHQLGRMLGAGKTDGKTDGKPGGKPAGATMDLLRRAGFVQ